MLETKTVTINGTQFRIQQLGALEARRVARVLLNEAGKGIAAASEAGARLNGEDVQAAVVSAVAAGVSHVLSGLDDHVLESLTETFLAKTSVCTSPGSGQFRPMDSDLQNALFGGGKGLATWIEWLAECVQFSTADFFVALVGLQKRFTPASPASESVAAGGEAEPVKSPNTSTGSFTGSRPPIAMGRR